MTESPASSGSSEDRTITIAVDAMGGDHAPDEVVAAVAEATLQEHGAPDGPRVFFTLVGDQQAMIDALILESHNPERIRMHHAARRASRETTSGEKTTTDQADEGLTSIEAACQLVGNGAADAVVTAGPPGAVMQAATTHFAPLPQVRRAALAAVYPTPRERGPYDDRFSLLLDVGASLEASADDLVDYALMGSAYSRLVSGLDAPQIGLLSTSPIPGAGPESVATAARRLQEDPRIDFWGTCEGQDIAHGVPDVVVCNGFVGNVVIKLLEGVAEVAVDMAESAYKEKMAWRVGLGLLSGGIEELKRMTDFEEYGGAPVLGLNRTLILAHARSHEKAFSNSLKLAIKNVKEDLPGRLTTLLADEEGSE